MHRLLLSTALTLSPLPLLAQSEPPAAPAAILVLDGSGSMWGQIDGINKIVIAREVVADLLADLPAELQLGLTVYGHRRRGDCSDIETLIAPAAGNRAAIRAAVEAINPRGRTPMTRAVVEAARALRYTEEPATVILVSDGIETCEADPCAIAAELEAAGVAFTAHVVGFDVAAEPEARAQMQCIADTTGGRFLTADNAEELAAALTEVAATVAQAPQPEPAAPITPALRDVGFSAVLRMGDTERALDSGVVFEVFAGEHIVMDATQTAAPVAQLPEGDYVLRALRLDTEEAIAQPFHVTGAQTQSVQVVFTDPLPPATLTAPASGPAGDMVSVAWDGPSGEGDYISVVAPDAGPLDHLTYAWTADGNPVGLRLPAQPGDYVIRYVLASASQVLAEVPVTVTAQQQALTAPASAPIGATVMVEWQGGGHDDDYLDVALPDAGPGEYLSYSYVRDGNPVGLRLPTFPGRYLVRYITGQDTSVFASQAIEVTDVPASLSAAASGAAGSTMKVTWQGPANPGDYLTITGAGDDPIGYVTYAYVDAGSPLDILLPDAPGTYELRYIADGPEARILASQPLQVN
ncbi:MAG: VWA domain-containing protein [Rhodobacter sp.]|nr:VWA domain-containing protein [Paracoccaceae bacterium]MCC0077166.1 VWA domain-containing protein [Rhodobacter sp.]